MKSKIFVLVLFLFTSNLFAQKIAFDLQYSGLLQGKNIESAALYSIRGNYMFPRSSFELGLEIAFLDGTISRHFLVNSPPNDNVEETRLTIGITWKYYPNFLMGAPSILKPYIGIDLGISAKEITLGIKGHTLPCEDQYNFNSDKYFYTNFVLGIILFPEKTVNFIIEGKYQLRQAGINYSKPNCNTSGPITYTELYENVNLNMFLGSIGLRVNL